MPLATQPCTTRECQEAALAALRAKQGMQSPSAAQGLFSPRSAGREEAGGAGNAFSSVLAASGGSGMSSLTSPPGTPATSGADLKAVGSGIECTPDDIPKAVRFREEERDNLHVGLKDTSRTSSADSLHRTYDAAVEYRMLPPTASGFHVVHTAGGKLEAVSSSARWEDVVGYSRAAKRGPFIYVSGTSAVDQASGRVMYRRDAYKQARLAFTIVERALEQVGATMEDVVRTRLFVRNLQRDGEGVSKAHGEVLGHVKPASTMVEVSRLVHEDILVLIEVDAIQDTNGLLL